MPKQLTPEQIRHFRQSGYVSPVRVLSEADAAAIRERLEAFEKSRGGPLHGSLRHKSHLLFPWLNDLIRERHIVDAIEDLFGENLLCWTTNFFIKEPQDGTFVSWHQDSTYWGLSAPDVVTAWVALSESNEENGSMQVIPGTHLEDQLPHRDTFAAGNLLTRGQEIAVDVDPSQAVSINLLPGEMSLHHVRIVHGSPPNRSAGRRIGFAIRYIPTYVRQLQGNDSATLVRGVDEYRTFEHEPRPERDLDPALVAIHEAVTRRNAQILYKGTAVEAF
jgi:ectoine hydroxylase-related dioxygenase (phytanoyl-CoA dioxygenase family)